MTTALSTAVHADSVPSSSSSCSSSPVQPLCLQGVIGFNGAIPRGLVLHPGDKHLIYPLGSTIVVRHLASNTQHFLQKDGHDYTVSAIALSPTGKYLASGQYTHMGFNAQVIIWNLESYSIHARLILHKGKIQDLCFSHNEQYLATLGGRDDNKLIVWSVESGEAICGATAANETTNTVRFFNNNERALVSGGYSNLRIWQFDPVNRKLKPTDCSLGQLKRVVTSITIDSSDELMYCGTQTGDCLKVNLSHALFKASGPKKCFSLGITATALTHKGNIIVGSGDGIVAVLKHADLTIIRKTQLVGGITSVALAQDGSHFFVGTSQCNIYRVNLQSFEFELRNTCHSTRINDVVFPHKYSELFATCSGSDIRIWNSVTRVELLRIQVPNVTCLCVCFSADGKSILSGWSDGKIRAFKPQSGKLMFAISDAHVGGVTAIAGTQDSKRIVSGGESGQIRVWLIDNSTQKMIASLKEHKGRIACIRISGDESECVSASSDGSCIIWSLQRFVRTQALFATTQFRSIVYHPDQSQLLTTGTDRKLTYWDVTDGQPIRIIDGSETDALNTLAISLDGEVFVCGGGDKQVTLWGYDEGYVMFRGIGHSGEVTKIAIAPSQQFAVSVGDEGAVFIWKMPIAHMQNTLTQALANTQTQTNEATEHIGKLRIAEEKEQPTLQRHSVQRAH